MGHEPVSIRPAGSDDPFAGAGTRLDAAAWVALAMTVPALLAAVIHAIAVRPTWYDEFYTFYVTSGRFGWWEALTGHWLTDNHPPLFYALSRATGWLGATIEARRLLNPMLAALAFVGAMAALRGDKAGRLLAILFFVLLAAQGAALPFYAEIRSYILSYAATALMVLVATLVWIDPAAPTRARRMVLFAATLAAFNTHVMTSVIAGSALAPFVIAAFLKRDSARLRAYLVPALAAGLLFCATAAIQISMWMANTGQFWIPAGAGQAWGALLMVGSYTAGANRLMLLGGLAGLGLMALQALRERRVSPRLEAALLLACGAVLAGGLCMAMHAWRPSVIPKYLIALIPVLALIPAVGLAALAEASRRLPGPLLVIACAAMTVLGLARHAGAVASQKGWDAGARVIARQVALCPGTTVHTDLHWNRYLAGLQPPDNARVVAWSYRLVASRHGFAVEPPASRRLGQGGCPALFWAQTISEPMPSMRDVLAWERRRGFVLGTLRLYHVEGAWIASTGPLDPSVVRRP